jgi:hypothetical protein
MNDSDKFDAAPDFGPDPKGLNEQLEDLRRLFQNALVAILIVSGSLAIFLVRQATLVRRDLKNVGPQVNQMVANYRANDEPEVNRFVNSLVAFARTNPDLYPILAKYKIDAKTSVPASPPAAATNPATVPAAPVKK